MAGKHKAQTVVERAARRAELGVMLTSHTCAAEQCPRPYEPIPLGELYPVVTMLPRRHTIFFHRACAPQIAVSPRH